MTNRTRLVSGRVVTSNSANVTSDRYQYLDLSSAEPNLGTANVGDLLIYDTAYPGARRWVPQTTIISNGTVGQQAFDKANGAYDTANSKVSKSGDTMTGDLKFAGGGGILGNFANNQIAITANVVNDVSGFIAAELGVSTVYANTDVIIQSNNGGVTNFQWNFTKDGTLTLPASSGQIGRSGYTNGIDLYNNSGGAGYVRINYADESVIWADSSGAHIQTNGSNTWNFGVDGSFSFPDGSKQYVAYDATYAQGAYFHANGAFIKANAAYNFANNISSSLTGNSIVLGANTTGLLVSNAVSLTTSTYITNGIAQMNQILGKLVPASPAAFPGSYGTLTINSLIGPYRMTNFTQQDNTGLSTTPVVAGGTSVSPLRTSTYTTSTIFLINTQTGDVMSVYKNNASFGTRTMTDGATNAGTYGDLNIITNVDYASTGSISYANFWYSANVRATGTVANGWNTVYITDTGGVKTANATWYYDNSAPGTPTFASASIVPLSTSLTYSSTIPHYNSSTTFRLGVDVSKLSGDMFPASNTFFTGTAGGAFGAPSSNTYPTVGITYPLARNLYVSSGSVTVNTTSTIVSGFGSSSTGPSVTVDNSYSTASQVFTTALANTVLYKTGTASLMEETSVTFGTTVGTGSGLAARIINPGTTDTPTYTASASLFNSQSSTLTANDATIVASTLKHDQTNYSTAYLPAGPNLSTGRTGAQYFTFRFVRTSVSKFDVKYTGTIAGLWVALPGSSIDTSSGLNGWMDMSTAYAGSGHPGTNSGGNGSNGCALGGTATLNSLVTNGSYTCTFGDVSSSSTATNEIYVRIKLTSGQTVSALTLQTASH